MHPPLTLHRHPMCAETTLLDGVFKFDVVIYRLTQLRKFKLVIEQFQKCHLDHPIAKFFGECTDLKIKLDRCFRQEKALKRRANFEESKKLKERLRAQRKEDAESTGENFLPA
ncbi:uncharacterized protein LOC131160724 isoform X2 [Malania oleifera]|uniref:uncharacterized protein LOC131160724 isoform X2 n=1 Tax=Malania oleifera TaxID=397392 RepID=UPI0025AE0D68|nr:uncharacterized protein LOC131160724 isoform X2 [Malania oleifera]XP_057972578.1 uncharacterized protein LOC131160724 isoform X2 [Malania oleifera]